jgi:branched-chain amino acid transport system ATP-binding protein
LTYQSLFLIEGTSFNLISGHLKPDNGRILFNGTDITGLKTHKICHQGIARTFQLTKPFSGMTAIQNVMVGKIYGGKSAESLTKAEHACRRLLEFVGLAGKESVQAHTFGTVDRKRLEIARALATEPELLLLDEMMSGLTPTEMEQALKLVKAISDSGVTLIVVEHVMKAIMNISSKLVVLNYGEKIAEGNPEEVVSDQKVVDAYLGE